jgi:cytosine/uracil/thiamine/allantoin permease
MSTVQIHIEAQEVILGGGFYESSSCDIPDMTICTTISTVITVAELIYLVPLSQEIYGFMDSWCVSLGPLIVVVASDDAVIRLSRKRDGQYFDVPCTYEYL